MFCNMCGQNKAGIHFSQVVDGEITELHLCDPCAKKKGIHLDHQLSVSDVLGGLSDKQSAQPKPKALVCDFCTMSYEEFRKNGRLGCANCYQTFREPLNKLLKRIHGSSKHNGKIPQGLEESLRQEGELDRLKALLEEAICEEKYELAAQIRDQIKSLSTEIKKGQADDQAQ